jgi:malonyl CoA-acyl carrier protein transacylase/aryl carrier-like protein
LSRSILDVLYPPGSAVAEGEVAITETAIAHPLLFALEWALAELWRSWGITPDVVLGHSLGEYVAVCVAGALEVEAALCWVAERARLMQSLPGGGAMASIAASEARVSAALRQSNGEVTIACINSRDNTVIAGAHGAVDQICRVLSQEGVECQHLEVSDAFHSSSMDPILEKFEEVSQRMTFTEPRVPVISSVTGEVVTVAELRDGTYWRRQMRDRVQFATAANTCLAEGVRDFVEVGPHPTLLGLVRRGADESDALGWWPSLRRQRNAREQIIESLGGLHTRGASVEWGAFYAPAAVQRVTIPAYPFDYTGRLWTSESDIGIAPELDTSVATRDRIGQSVEAGSCDALLESLRSCTSEQRVEMILKWLRRQLEMCVGRNARSFSAESNLLTEGLDSLRVLDLLSLVRRHLRVTCTAPEFLTRPTLAQFSRYLAVRVEDSFVEADGPARSDHTDRSRLAPRSNGTGPNTQMIMINEQGVGTPLICFHPAGGQATCYVRLFGLVGTERPVYSIQSRAIDNPAHEHESLESMAIDYATLIQASRADGPYCGSASHCDHAATRTAFRSGASVS